MLIELSFHQHHGQACAAIQDCPAAKTNRLTLADMAAGLSVGYHWGA